MSPKWFALAAAMVSLSANAPEKPTVMPQSPITTFAFRLKPGDDLKRELAAFAKREQLRAGMILTGVGSLTEVNIRYANRDEGTLRQGHFEILSLVGMLDADGMHIHMTVADRDGIAFGGHLLDGCIVYTTAEIAVGELTGLRFSRELDAKYGYKELVVSPRRE